VRSRNSLDAGAQALSTPLLRRGLLVKGDGGGGRFLDHAARVVIPFPLVSLHTCMFAFPFARSDVDRGICQRQIGCPSSMCRSFEIADQVHDEDAVYVLPLDIPCLFGL